MTAVLLGSCFGVGLWLLATWLVPARQPLGRLLSELEAHPANQADGDSSRGWVTRAGRPFVRPLEALGLPGPRIRRDLAVNGVMVQAHLATKAVFAIGGLLTPAAATASLSLIGTAPTATVPLLAGLGFALIGFLVPDLRVRTEAARRRRDFRHALSAYLDLVVVSLAGGAGVDGALHDSTTVGRGPAFAQLRRALDTARLTRVAPWTTLRQLGEDLGVNELAELAASVSLAGTEGAKVRESLGAKAKALRTHQRTDAEGQEQSATERMSLPVTLLFLGFLVFIGYPATYQILTGL